MRLWWQASASEVPPLAVMPRSLTGTPGLTRTARNPRLAGRSPPHGNAGSPKDRPPFGPDPIPIDVPPPVSPEEPDKPSPDPSDPSGPGLKL